MKVYIVATNFYANHNVSTDVFTNKTKAIEEKNSILKNARNAYNDLFITVENYNNEVRIYDNTSGDLIMHTVITENNLR